MSINPVRAPENRERFQDRSYGSGKDSQKSQSNDSKINKFSDKAFGSVRKFRDHVQPKNNQSTKNSQKSSSTQKAEQTEQNHIFDDRPGHLIDTPENRKRIENLVKDFKNFLGPSKWGNLWYGETLPDGTQLWAEVRGKEIRNCGINDTPAEYNPTTGLSALKAPGNNNTK